MWEISEGDTKFLCTMKLVSLKDLGTMFIPTLFIENIIIIALYTKRTNTIHHHGIIH